METIMQTWWALMKNLISRPYVPDGDVEPSQVQVVLYDDAQATVEALQRERDAWKARTVELGARAQEVFANGQQREAEMERLVARLDAEREKVAQLSEENNNLVVELAELRETVTDLKCSFHGRLSTAQTDLSQLQALVRALPVVLREVVTKRGTTGGIEVVGLSPQGDLQPCYAEFPDDHAADAYAALLTYRATLAATTPAAKGGDGE